MSATAFVIKNSKHYDYILKVISSPKNNDEHKESLKSWICKLYDNSMISKDEHCDLIMKLRF